MLVPMIALPPALTHFTLNSALHLFTAFEIFWFDVFDVVPKKSWIGLQNQAILDTKTTIFLLKKAMSKSNSDF